MSYVRRVLQPDEAVVYTTKLHWLIYLRAILLGIVAVILTAALTHDLLTLIGQFNRALVQAANHTRVSCMIHGVSVVLVRDVIDDQ